MQKNSSLIRRLLRSKKLLQAEIVVLALLIITTSTAVVFTNLPMVEITQTPAPIAISNENLIVETTPEDQRVTILRAYLEKKNSPLVPHAEDFIEAADTYDVDWKLVPAITGVESSFGRHIPGGHSPATISYNGWGWGVYGTQSLKFKSWRDGIFTVTVGLKKNYINKGLTTPMAMNRVYASSPTWGSKVTFFMNDLTKFEKEFVATQVSSVDAESFETSIAGASGKLLAASE